MRINDDELLRLYGRLFELMEEWAHWNRGYSMRLGFRSRSIGLCSNHSKDCDEALGSRDPTVMNAIETAVQEDLNPAERAAILRRYGVAAVFRFPRGNYAELLVSAHARLLEILPRKNVVITPTAYLPMEAEEDRPQ